jgi:hypothetical protein
MDEDDLARELEELEEQSMAETLTDLPTATPATLATAAAAKASAAKAPAARAPAGKVAVKVKTEEDELASLAAEMTM